VRYGILNQFVGSFHTDLVYSFLSDWASIKQRNGPFGRKKEQTIKYLIMAKETC
jgi:hypothetical protein